MPRIHPQATHGFHAASSYDTHRPTYPQPAVSALLSAIGVAGCPGARLVELGAGTGKFTALLAAREEGFEVVAGEPHGEMRGVLEGKRLAGVRVVGDRGEDLASVEGRWTDGVVVAQAFHWFATIETLEEIKRVLKPGGGGLGMIWNVDDFNAPIDHTPSTPYEARLKAIIRSLPNPISLYRELKWMDVLQLEQQQLFEWPLHEDEVAYGTRLSRDQIWERFATMSQVSSLKGDELQVRDGSDRPGCADKERQ
ncbi:hypothetical protein PMIN02_002706 [Paraphaeosphaeria minitans]